MLRKKALDADVEKTVPVPSSNVSFHSYLPPLSGPQSLLPFAAFACGDGISSESPHPAIEAGKSRRARRDLVFYGTAPFLIVSVVVWQSESSFFVSDEGRPSTRWVRSVFTIAQVAHRPGTIIIAPLWNELRFEKELAFNYINHMKATSSNILIQKRATTTPKLKSSFDPFI